MRDIGVDSFVAEGLAECLDAPTAVDEDQPLLSGAEAGDLGDQLSRSIRETSGKNAASVLPPAVGASTTQL